jgi:hypothetical protein
MAYMVYQQYTTAVLDAYQGRSDVAEQYEKARSHRRWLESLELQPKVKGILVEQARAIEEAFEQLTAHGSSNETTEGENGRYRSA